MTAWDALNASSTKIYDSLSSDFKTPFFEMVQHPVLASSTLGKMWILQGMNNLRASQARLSTNDLADQVEALFEQDYDLELEYHQLLDGKPRHSNSYMNQLRLFQESGTSKFSSI